MKLNKVKFVANKWFSQSFREMQRYQQNLPHGQTDRQKRQTCVHIFNADTKELTEKIANNSFW